MKQVIKRILVYVLICVLSCTIGLVATYSFLQSTKLSTAQEIQSLNNVTDGESRGMRRAILRSRNSTVNVMSMSTEGIIGSSSGTYILFNNNYYILTVSHGIREGCESLRIIVGASLYECLSLPILDTQQDYAIIQVEEIIERTPIKIPDGTPKNYLWDESLAVQSQIIYSGFPNSSGLLTIDGRIVGFNHDENIFIHSYAWPGASGSGVFNEDGKLIGYIMAISLGFTEYGISVLEDIVIVVPLYKIDWEHLEHIQGDTSGK